MTDEAKEQEVTPEQRGPMVYGNGLEHILHLVYDSKDVEGCMGVLPYHPCETVLGVCQKHIKIEGNDQDGFRFVAADDEGEEILERQAEREEAEDEEGQDWQERPDGAFDAACKIISDLSKEDCKAQKRRWAREWLGSIGYKE